MKRALIVSWLALVLASGCRGTETPALDNLSSFQVSVSAVYLAADAGSKVPLDVVSSCTSRFGNQQNKVPAAERGTKACPYVIPRGSVDVEVSVTAINLAGQVDNTFSGPISFRPVPGDLTGDYDRRRAVVNAGTGKGTVRIAHVFGETRVWAEDAPPQDVLDSAGLRKPSPDDDYKGVGDAGRTFATGISQTIYFEEPTLAKVQIPDGQDNRSSPLVGQFLAIGKPPESGAVTIQSCAHDKKNDQKKSQMVITGTDPGGFFVTDMTACRQLESVLAPDTDVDEPIAPGDDAGYLPGTFGSMYVYNYSFPEGLDPGDLLWSLNGSLQEFTSTTQLVFPSWTIREKVAINQRQKYLQAVPVVDVNLRLCGITQDPELTDVLCGHNRRNMKLESLESALVRVRNVKFPQEFKNCDFNGNAEVPFFCESFNPTELADGGVIPPGFYDCDFESDLPGPDERELRCNADCVTGRGEFKGKSCSEEATFEGFGQFIVDLPSAGAAEGGLDESLDTLRRPDGGLLPGRSTSVTVAAGSPSTRLGKTYVPEDVITVWCSGPTRLKAGDSSVVASATDELIPARTVVQRVLTATETRLAFIPDTTATGTVKCSFSQNPRTRINLVTKDAVPELSPNCSTSDPDAEKAAECLRTKSATYDVVGHLRHLQPGRPRWSVLPRDSEDICCRPGPGLVCPKPIKQCPQ